MMEINNMMEKFFTKLATEFYNLNKIDKSCISLMVDYESPNSSDDRLIGKDFEKYLNFRIKSNLNIPYRYNDASDKKRWREDTMET